MKNINFFALCVSLSLFTPAAFASRVYVGKTKSDLCYSSFKLGKEDSCRPQEGSTETSCTVTVKLRGNGTAKAIAVESKAFAQSGFTTRKAYTAAAALPFEYLLNEDSTTRAYLNQFEDALVGGTLTMTFGGDQAAKPKLLEIFLNWDKQGKKYTRVRCEALELKSLQPADL